MGSNPTPATKYGPQRKTAGQKMVGGFVTIENVLVKLPCSTIGDSIAAFPTVFGFCETQDVFLAVRNRAVRDVVPSHPRLFVLDERDTPPMECDHEPMKIYKPSLSLCMHKAVATWTKTGEVKSMTQALRRLSGMDWSQTHYAVPTLDVPAIAHFDFILAPFCADMQQRGWPLEAWYSLVTALKLEYRDPVIGIVGGPQDPRFMEGVEYLFGLPLAQVVAYMRGASKAVVTVDSAANWLAQLAGIDHHILLTTPAVPYEWSVNPAAAVHIHEPNTNVNVVTLDVARAIRRVLGQEVPWLLS